MALDILVLLVVVLLIFQRLWKVLGTVNEDEPRRLRLSKEGAEKLYDLLKSETEKELKKSGEVASELSPVDESNLSENDKLLRQIPDFNRDTFLKGAKKAFEMITHAFNSADVETLKILVSPGIAEKMETIIKQRKEDKMTAETDFIGFSSVDIKKVELNESDASIAVEFVSEQVNVLRNENGEIIEGDENYIQNITDVWTFKRPLKTKKTNWVLVSTKK